MKTGGCVNLVLRPQTGSWFRALNLRHWKTRLSTDQSKTSRSRFSNASLTAPFYRVLYLGENHQVAIYEVGALLGNPNAPLSSPKGSWVLMSLQEGQVILAILPILSNLPPARRDGSEWNPHLSIS
jgi:hypothetical protein